MGLPRLSWTALEPQRPLKPKSCLGFLHVQVFGTLKLLMGLLEPILAHLRPIWSQKGSPELDKKCSKKCPKTGPKHDRKNNQKVANFGPQNGVQNEPRWRRPATVPAIREVSWKLLVPRCPKVAQDTPKMAQEGPKMPQDGLKTAPRWPKMALRWPKMATKWPKMASRRPQDGPRWLQVAQDGPKMAQDGFNFSFLPSLPFPFLSVPFFPFISFSFLSNRMGGLPKAINF